MTYLHTTVQHRLGPYDAVLRFSRLPDAMRYQEAHGGSIISEQCALTITNGARPELTRFDFRTGITYWQQVTRKKK